MKILTQDEVIARLRAKQGDQSAAELARQLGISAAFLSELFRKTRHVPKPILKILGIGREKATTYTYFELNGKRQSLSARTK
jgi:hypothetical protein